MEIANCTHTENAFVKGRSVGGGSDSDMARLKMEWKAQMRNKQRANTHAPVYQQQQHQHPPAAAIASANCIDLTIDDNDSEEDDEPLVPISHHPHALRSPPRSAHAVVRSGESAPLMSSRPERAQVSVGNDISGRLAPEAEPVESDVDEEWPQPAQPVPASSASTQAPRRLSATLSFSDDKEEESEEDEELPKRVAGSSTKRGTVAPAANLSGEKQQVAAASEEIPSADVIEDIQVEASDAGNVSAVEEEGTRSASPANSDAATSQEEAGSSAPAAKKADAVGDDDEYLEDGEIFEEGAVIASPTKVKQAIALERLASRASGDSETVSPQRQKKQKKRGKKKSKRKLDAMMLMTGDGGGDIGAGSEFERNTRHHPFLLPATLDQHMAEVDSMMMMYGGPHPPPLGISGGFGAHPPLPLPPPHFRMHGGPPMPGGPPVPPQFAGPPPPSSGPFPPFADDQILRVNRHGNVEMFNSNVEYPRGMPPPPPLPPQPPAMLGGFKYRNVPPHPPRAPDSVSSRSSTGSSSSSGSSNQSPEKPGDVPNVNNAKATTEEPFDLDSLRAAALRTKRLSKTVSENESAKADAAMTEERSATPSPSVVPGADNNAAANVDSTPSIDELRAEILRSMMMKKKAARPVTASFGSTQSQVPQKSESAPEAKVSSPVSVDQQQQQPDEGNDGSGVQTSEVQKTPSPPLAPEAAVVEKKAIVPTPSPTTPPPTPRVDYSSLAVSTGTTFVTPKFRPLTASSQSIVICLSPEDYAKSSKTGDDGGANSSGSSSSTIQSAIDEMRKKIAEKEKLRKESRSGTVGEDGDQKNAAVNDAGTGGGTKKKTVENGNGRQTPENNSVALANAEGAKQKSIATRSSLQARIEEMKKQIAAKEMEKSNNNGASSTSSSTRASAASSPRMIKKPTDTPAATAVTNGVSVTTCVASTVATTVRVAAMAREAPAAAADDPQKKAPCTSSKSKDALAVESLGKEDNAQLLDQQQQEGGIGSQPESTVNGSTDQDGKEYSQVLPKKKLNEYQKLYSLCVADYEEARNQVATLDDAIAKLREEIASMESASAVSSSG